MEIKYVEINERKVAYFEGGKGKPLILVHGLMSSKEAFLPLAKSLQNRYHLIIPDMPGFGNSDSYMNGEDLNEYATFLSQLNKSLNIEIPNYFGSSFGALVCLLYSLQYPKTANKIILRAPFYDMNQLPENMKSIYMQTLVKTILNFPISQKYAAKLATKLYPRLILQRHKANLSEEEMQNVLSYTDLWLKRMQETESRVAVKNILMNLLDLNLQDQIRTVEDEMLILWQSRDTVVGNSGKELASLIKTSQYQEFTSPGHGMSVDNFEFIAGRIIEFIDQT